MSPRFLLIFTSLSLLLTYFVPSTAFATGACCAVTKGEKNRLYISGTVASAWSHEMIDGKQYNLDQQALLLKFGYPIMENLTIQAQVGLPVATQLSHHNSSKMQGNSWWKMWGKWGKWGRF